MDSEEHPKKAPYARPKRLPSAPRVNCAVTEELIRKSVKRDSGHCMIADAIREAVPGATHPAADIQTIRFTLNGFRYAYLTPRNAQAALIMFDQGEEPPPFTFQLRTGQTTRAGSRAAKKTGVPQPRTEAQKKVTEKAMGASTHGFRNEPATLVRGKGRQETVPEIRGGRVPPVSMLAGGPGVGSTVPRSRRREFGLRAMDRLK